MSIIWASKLIQMDMVITTKFPRRDTQFRFKVYLHLNLYENIIKFFKNMLSREKILVKF
jgi:hypothetical protein